jgi:hypothetical protein
LSALALASFSLPTSMGWKHILPIVPNAGPLHEASASKTLTWQRHLVR